MKYWKEWDITLFKWINSEQVYALLDIICPILRFPKTWIPLYISLFFIALFHFKKDVWLWVIFTILCITLTDQISSQWLKYLFDRPRPCHVPEITNVILRVNRCPGNASFPSSHAVNHMGIAIFFIGSLAKQLKSYKFLLWLWPFSIAYAQVYVGVHYPIDVLGGLAIGAILGFIPLILFKYCLKKIRKRRL